MEETQWWRLACQELLLSLYDEHAIFRNSAEIHNTQFANFVPSDQKNRFEVLAVTNEKPALSLQAFVRQFVKHSFVRECFFTSQSHNHESMYAAFYAHIPKARLKKEVSKLFKCLRANNPRANYLRNCIRNARRPLESSTYMAKTIPFSRNFIDLKVNLGPRTKLLKWFASRKKLPTKRVVNNTLPKLSHKKVDNLLNAQNTNKLSQKLLAKYGNKPPAIVRALRLHGGNTGKWSAEALQHIFWYECMVGKWDSDLSKEHLIEALKVVVTNANDLIYELKNESGTIFPKSTLHYNRKIFQSL